MKIEIPKQFEKYFKKDLIVNIATNTTKIYPREAYQELQFMLKYIYTIMRDILLVKEDGIIKPVKNTSKKDVYKALYTIQNLLRTNIVYLCVDLDMGDKL